MYDDLQTLENPALREYLKLDKSVQGMVVHRPSRRDAAYPLKEWDVITHIGDTPIDNQGMIKLGQGSAGELRLPGPAGRGERPAAADRRSRRQDP